MQEARKLVNGSAVYLLKWPTIHTGDRMTGDLALTGVYWQEHVGFNDCDLTDWGTGLLISGNNQDCYATAWAKNWDNNPLPIRRDICTCGAP